MFRSCTRLVVVGQQLFFDRMWANSMALDCEHLERRVRISLEI